MIYPRIAAGLEYKDKGSHCPREENRAEISLDAIRKSWTELEGGVVCRTILGLIVEKIMDDISVAYFCF